MCVGKDRFRTFDDFAESLFCCTLSYSKCNRVKGLAELHGQFAICPGRVREYEIQQHPLGFNGTIFEEFAGTLCHFQKCDAFYRIGLIGKFVVVNVAFHPELLGPVLFGLFVKEFHAHTAVEAIV